MYLDDIQRLYDYTLDKYKKDNNTLLVVAGEIEIYRQVLKAIAMGQCRDYPPEDFAQEVLRVFKHEI